MSTQSNQLSLNNYRLFGNSGLRVSPLSLGTMTFGAEWGSDKKASRKIFDAYAERGGNFIDTANKYSGGVSEEFIGEFIKGRRDRFVLATKYTGSMDPSDPNAGGNHRKSLRRSVEDSLKRLDTDYIDLLWLHVWENRTPWDEILRTLDDLVSEGKILYIGASDTPAWQVARANEMAKWRNFEPFIGLQIEYSLAQRTPERDLIPMAQEFDLAVTPWSPLAGGVLLGKYDESDLRQAEAGEVADDSRAGLNQAINLLNERNIELGQTVVRLAEKINCTPAQLALRWNLDQPGITAPIIGARTLGQLEDNLGCLSVDIPHSVMEELNEASQIDLGFPHDFLNTNQVNHYIDGDSMIEPAKSDAEKPNLQLVQSAA
jgi:aryl-alcohol dehydrogenase-like predicted oxidoreductase